MKSNLKFVIVSVVATTFLMYQPQTVAQATDKTTIDSLKVDSLRSDVNILKPKIESIGLYDSLQLYKAQSDSIKKESKFKLHILRKQQKQIKRLPIIDTTKT